MRRLVAVGAWLIVSAVVGCGGANIATVSGVVKVDGKPYKDAIVSFQPIGDKGNQNPGRGSAGVTDAAGRYSLDYDGEKPGAIVGKHRVRIFTKFGAEMPADASSESVPGGKFVERIPAEWHDDSTKEFTVPAAGTATADFDIVTKKPAKQ